MKKSLLRPLLLAVVTAGLAGTLLTAPAAPSVAGTSSTPPAVGDCHAMTPREAVAATDPDRAVDCRRTHTSRTFAVPRVPAGVDMSDMDALAGISETKCRPAYYRAVHPSTKRRLLSTYTFVWFAPTAAEIEDGARWIRCDLALIAGTDLAPLPAARKPALRSTGRVPDAEARCYGRVPQGYRITVCARPHVYRSTVVFQMSGRAYPGQRAVDRATRRHCEPASRSGRYASFGPTTDQWKAGFRYFVCVDATRD